VSVVEYHKAARSGRQHNQVIQPEEHVTIVIDGPPLLELFSQSLVLHGEIGAPLSTYNNFFMHVPRCFQESDVGVHAVTVPHGLDSTICTGPYPYRSGFFSTYWMDGRWTVFAHPCPSKVQLSWPLRWLSNISESSQAPKHNHRYAAQFKSSTFTHFVDY